ncbi:CoA-transferase family III domain-containing protein [Hyaloraphidium curvatum]|nr:CoA-transferase family III domain-containing protein [Hyaloraphidium curvatum]
MEATAREVALRCLRFLDLSPSDYAIASDSVARTGLVPTEGLVVPSPFKVTELSSGILAAIGAVCNLISKERIAKEQEITVDMGHATATMSSHFTYRVDNLSAPESAGLLARHHSDPNDRLRGWRGIVASAFRCADGRYIVFVPRPLDTPEKLLPAIGFESKEVDEMVSLLGTPDGRREHAKRLTEKIASWNSSDLEKSIISRSATAGIVGLTEDDFLASPHGRAAKMAPAFEILPAKPSPAWQPTPWTRISKPLHGILHGIKVVEISRVLLGPRTGCLLAALGASVVRVNPPNIDEGLGAVDVNLGKLSLLLDLKKPDDRKKFEELLDECDVFITNNTPGVAEKLGAGIEDMWRRIAGRSRGMVYAQANCFGFRGPYSGVGGYEQLAQFLSGVASTHGEYHRYDGPVEKGRPTFIPTNVLDICTGHFLALGIIGALNRRARDGGSCVVQNSLLQTAMFLQTLDRLPRPEVEKAWARFAPEPATIDSERGGGTVGWFCAFQCAQLPVGSPWAFKEEYYLPIEDSPWLPPGHVLHVVRPALSMDSTPVRHRISTRPMGWDSVASFPDLEEGGDLVFEEGGRARYVGHRK